MRLCLLAFCFGLALPSRFATVSASDLHCTLALVAALVLARWAGRAKWKAWSATRASEVSNEAPEACKALWKTALCVLLGMAWALWLALRQQAVQFPVELEGVDFWVEGVVTGLVQSWERSQRFEFRVDSNCFRLLPEPCADQPAILVGQRILLNDYSDLNIVTGERWRLRVRLTRAYGLSNPGTRDSQARLRQQGIVATGYVRETPFNVGQGEEQGWQPLIAVQRWRMHIGAILDDINGLAQRGVIKALVIGDYSGLGSAQWEIFNITGTSHLMVISGMHIGFVALLVYGLVNVLCRLSTTVLSVVAAQRVASVAALLAGLMYSLLAGFSLPAQRAMIMLTVLMAGRLFGRRLLPSYSLLLAATLVLMRDPLAVTQPGFWLSFMAVASLLVGFVGYIPIRERNGLDRERNVKPGLGRNVLSLWQRGWRRWVAPQWVVSCGLLLPLLVWTGQVSIVSPLTNVFAIPLVSLAVVPAALLGTLLLSVAGFLSVSGLLSVPGVSEIRWGSELLGSWLLTVADSLLQWMMPILTWVAAAGQAEPGAVAWPVVWQPAPPGVWSGLLLALASVILLLPRGLIARWYALLLLLPILWPQPPPRPAQGELWAHFLDVGQGLAVVLQTRDHALLFDTGPSLGDELSVGQTVIVPFLRRQRIDNLQLVIVSHWHDDHSGGLQSVLQQWPVSAVVAGRRPDRPLDMTHPSGVPAAAGVLPLPNIGPGLCRAGWSWVWDEVSFTMLHPDGARYGRENDYSCVLRVEAGAQSLLLTGDIEAAAERLLVARRGSELRTQVLQAAHHGSRTSSTAAFLDAVQPGLVIIPAAYHNRFAHPADEVVARLAERDISVLQTGRSGAITLRLGAPGAPHDTDSIAPVSEHRLQARRHWHHLPP